jgi:adenylosuccinate lyase
VIAPDATIALDFMLARMTGVLARLVVRPERMRQNLESSGGAVLSENVLLALVRAGAPREEAYRWVQRAARAASEGRAPFAEALAAEPEVLRRLTRAGIAKLLDPERHLAQLDLLFRRGLGSSERGSQRGRRAASAAGSSRGATHE